jgi:hypothetical protein
MPLSLEFFKKIFGKLLAIELTGLLENDQRIRETDSLKFLIHIL